jgi:STE24 endopeptidase
VLLSDALLEHMEDREVKAIFAHEAGHIVSHHLLYSLMFAMATVVLCGTAGSVLAAGLHTPGWAGQAATLALLAAAWGIGFGWLSRRFERQSDVIGAWASAPGGPARNGAVTPEGAAIFARSLQRVAELNGIPLGQRSWRHGSIARRIEHVLWLGTTGGTRQAIDRVVRRIKLGLWVATAAAAVAAGLDAAFIG